ncbi:MAG: HD domain-containing protein [Planctomycetes bacterium]|nr:HD domain-containing protein [Planctomycetota bacterium]
MNPTDQATPFDPTTAATVLVDEITAALVNARIYEAKHPRVQNSLAAVRRSLGELARETGEPVVSIAIADDLIVFRHQPLLGASIGAARLIELLQAWRSGGLEFDAAPSNEELAEFLLALATRPRPEQDFAHLNRTLAERQCRSARLLPPYVQAQGGGSGDGDAGAAGDKAPRKIRVGVRFYQSLIDLLQNVTVSLCRGGRIDFAPVQTQAEQLLKQLDDRDEPLLGLARQDQYDAFTFGHSVRVAILSLHFARQLTDDRDLLIRIGTAALLHDVGKSLIPFEILHATGVLNEEERRLMNRHAELGAECLLCHDDADPLAIAAAFGHHRGPDGTGYPRTVHPHETDMVTDIVKICDVFEALTAARPYKQPMSPIRAYRVMLAMGDKLNRRLLRRFIEVNGIYPVGQFVELDDGTVAVVREQTGSALQPKVAVVDANYHPDLVDDSATLLDLADVSCPNARAILPELTPEQAREQTRQPAAPQPRPA